MQNCVCMNSAPACIFASSPLGCQSAGGSTGSSVGHVDRRNQALQRERPLDEFRGVGGNRRGKLGGNHETSVPQVLLQITDGAARRLLLRGQIHSSCPVSAASVARRVSASAPR